MHMHVRVCCCCSIGLAGRECGRLLPLAGCVLAGCPGQLGRLRLVRLPPDRLLPTVPKKKIARSVYANTYMRAHTAANAMHVHGAARPAARMSPCRLRPACPQLASPPQAPPRPRRPRRPLQLAAMSAATRPVAPRPPAECMHVRAAPASCMHVRAGRANYGLAGCANQRPGRPLSAGYINKI
jgi:hypothetical protein